MPARPMIFDEIDQKMKGAQVDVLVPKCCVPSCGKPMAGFISLSYTTGSVDVYAFCKTDLKEMRDRHPSKLERESKQGAFFYAGS